MRTRVSDMLGVEFPILAFSHCRDVVAAVTNAGGFGVLGAVAHTPDQLEIDLTWIEEQTHGRPYGLDLLLPTKYAGADEGGIDRDTVRQLLPAEQQEFVDDILRRYGVPDIDEDTRGMLFGRGTIAISPKGYEPLLDIAFAHKIRLIASALGPPPPDLIERAHASDVAVAALAGTRVHAPPPLQMPLQTALVAEAQLRINKAATQEGSGAQELANYFVGQVVGQMDRVRPARQVVLDMVTEYADVAQSFADQVAETAGT